DPGTDPALWTLSARSPAALRSTAARLADRLTADPRSRPVDIGYTLATARDHFEHRAVIPAADRATALAGLRGLAEADHAAIRGRARHRREAVFVFGGHGSQWDGMAARLAAESPVFAAKLAECGEALRPHVDWNLAA